MVLIGIVGKKYSGKDTFADICLADFKKYSFASSIKNLCKKIFFLTDEQLYGSKKEEVINRLQTTPRKIMQMLGDGLKDEFGENIFINNFKKFLEENKGENIVVSDVRFIDEFKTIKELGGKIVKIKRWMVYNDAHISENALDGLDDSEFDLIVDNNGTLESLMESSYYFRKILGLK